MLTGIDSKETREYVCASDDGDPKTTFFIQNLSHREKMRMLGELVDREGRMDTAKIRDRAVDLFVMGVAKITNFYDPKKKETITIEKVDESVVDSIPFEAMCEIAGKVVEYNFVSESERKK